MLCLPVQRSAAQAPAVNNAPGATTGQQSKTQVHHRKTAAKEAPVPQAPAPPPTLEQTPPSQPRITYSKGQLTIDAANSTLAQVLRSVQTQTGATIEMPSSAAGDRVVAHLGPGPARDIINALLNGSRFDYIILGVAGNPGGVQRIILTTRQSAASAVNTAQNNNNPGQPQGQAQIPGDEPQEEEMQGPGAEVVGENPPEEQPQIPVPGRFRPMPPNLAEQQQENGNGTPPNGVKSPEQLLQELQKMQQQQQMMQQQLNPANQNPQQEQQ